MPPLRCLVWISALATAVWTAATLLAGTAAAQAVPMMTIEIFNNSEAYNIYPVLSTGGHDPDDAWLQAQFKVPKADLKNNPYPNPDQFRLYFTPTGTGIPPHGAITVRLPLYTQLAANPDPQKPAQYIDWWNGGRIEIYESPIANGRPPKTLVENYSNRPAQKQVTAVAGAAVPTCAACQQPLQMFQDPAGLPSNDPAQLTEFTLGAIDRTKDPYKLDYKNVDYDVSYVDNAYLPAAMEPYNYPLVGWIGTIQAIYPFKEALRSFLQNANFAGWPVFVDNYGGKTLKIPSALHIMLDQESLTPRPPWTPVENMKVLWRTCVGGGQEQICTLMRKVRDMFVANYTNYINNYRTAFKESCNQAKEPQPKVLDEKALLAHVYGWGPFNDNCGAAINLLENTPGYKEKNSLRYQEVKNDYDGLQYWPTGEFNPYVILIHGERFLNAKYVYAYSVDDAVGNMQTTGEGLIIAVGGPQRLPNPKPATQPVHVPFGWAAEDKVRFVQYGVCTKTPNQDVNPDYHSFDVPIDILSTCTMSFVDNFGRTYFLKVKSPPPFPPPPPRRQPIPDKNKAMIDCSGNTPEIARTWCAHNFGYTEEIISHHRKEEYYISVAAPAQPANP